VIDLEHLLAEAVEQPPCGPNLEYDADFLEVEKLAQGKPEQQFGDTVIPSEEPEWAEVRERAAALLARSKDLRIAVLLTRSLIHELGIGGLATGLSVVAQLLERYWDRVYPELDRDESNDPTMRLNALAPLTDPDTVLRDLRRSWFLRSRSAGQLLVRDVEVALGKLPAPAEGAGVSQEQVDSIVRTAAAEDMAPIQAVRQAAQSLRALNRLLGEKVGSERAPDLGPLSAVLGTLELVCDRVLGMPGAVAGTAPGEAVRAPPGAGETSRVSGEIGSRDDAIHMLDRVCEYLERHEPTNPAPLLIRRAKRLMTMSFVDIIHDLVPESVAQIEAIAGVKQKE
jgi:type VI secretion system protein ImpA